MTGIQPMLRRVIDVQENRMESSPRGFHEKADPRVGREGKEIPLHIARAWIRGEPLAEGHHPLLVPADHGLQKVDDAEGPHVGIPVPHISQCCGRGVSQSQPSDDHIQKLSLRRHHGCQPQIRQRLLHRMKEATHQELPVEDDLVHDLILQHRDLAPAQDQFTEGSGAVVELFEGLLHEADL